MYMYKNVHVLHVHVHCICILQLYIIHTIQYMTLHVHVRKCIQYMYTVCGTQSDKFPDCAKDIHVYVHAVTV